MSFVLTHERRGGARRTLDPRSDEKTAHLNRKMSNIAILFFSVNLTKYLQQDERVRGFLSVDGTLNSKYHQYKINEALSVEH